MHVAARVSPPDVICLSHLRWDFVFQWPQPVIKYRNDNAVARRYSWITDYTPVNEPLTTARFSGLYGHWYPHGRCDRDNVRALMNQLKAIVLAMRAIRQVTPDARLIQTEDRGWTFGTRATRPQLAHERERAWMRAARPRFSALSSRGARLVRSLDAALQAFSEEWMSTRGEEDGRLQCASP